MMRTQSLLAVSTILFSLAGLTGCTGGDADGDAGAGGAAGTAATGGSGSENGGAAGGPSRGPGAGASTGAEHAEPPPPVPAGAPDGTGHVTFAIRTLLLGNRDRDGRPDTGAWRRYGFDLDHLASGAQAPDRFRDLCTPLFGVSPANVQTDGEAGIDNAFGETLLPLAIGVDPRFPAEVAAGLAGGGTTLLVDLERLGAGAAYTGLTARLYTGAPLGHAPAYDGTDVWPVRADSLVAPADVASPRLLATDTYVAGDTWVGRFHGVLTLELPWLETVTMHLFVRDPVITMHLSADRTAATDGTIAGVIATEDLIAEATDDALRLDPTLCPDTPSVKAVLAELATASDILADGTQDPTRPCDGISIGLGFTAQRVALGPVVAPAPVAPTPACSVGD